MAKKILRKLLRGKQVVHWGGTDKSGISTLPEGRRMQTQIIFSVQRAAKALPTLSRLPASACFL